MRTRQATVALELGDSCLLSCIYCSHYIGVYSRVGPSPDDEFLTHALHQKEADRARPDLPCPARPTPALPGLTQSNTAFLQVDISRVEPFLGPTQEGAGPSLYADPAFPLPCHGTDPEDEAAIPAGFSYTPTNWCSASPTALAYCDDGCGASMAHSHAHQQPASNILGDGSVDLLSFVHHKHVLRIYIELFLSRLQYDCLQLLPSKFFVCIASCSVSPCIVAWCMNSTTRKAVLATGLAVIILKHLDGSSSHSEPPIS